jgi:hypothetical protein
VNIKSKAKSRVRRRELYGDIRVFLSDEFLDLIRVETSPEDVKFVERTAVGLAAIDGRAGAQLGRLILHLSPAM